MTTEQGRLSVNISQRTHTDLLQLTLNRRRRATDVVAVAIDLLAVVDGEESIGGVVKIVYPRRHWWSRRRVVRLCVPWDSLDARGRWGTS